jgi:KaiC/GvpD/RAD55 family RecA-like ATPase
MITTGVESLDGRIGSLAPGATYAFFGPAGSGKSILGLHFLINGLQNNEKCVLITRDDPLTVDSRAAYLGQGPARLTAHPSLKVIQLPDRLPTNLSLTPESALVGWLTQQIGNETPSRVVMDNVEFLSEYSHTPRALLHELTRFLARLGATSYALVQSERDSSFDRICYDPILERAEGTFVLQVSDTGQRTFAFHRAPPGTFRAEPLAYTLRNGGGFSEELHLADSTISPADRKRVVVVDEIAALSPDVLVQLKQLYDLELLSTGTGVLSRLSSARFGALVLVVDPFDEARAFDLAFALRKEGNAAPIIFAAPSRGLRSTTRSRGLRVGGDDFFIADLPPAEIIERIQMAWLRGGHSRSGLSQIGQIIQPVNGNGQARPMTQPEFLQTMATLLKEEPPLFFCYVEFTLREDATDLVWPSLRRCVRIGDGDIIGVLSSNRIACVLDRITPEQTERVIDRIRAAHPALNAMTGVTVIPSPMKSEEIRALLRLSPPAPAPATHGSSTNSAPDIQTH